MVCKHECKLAKVLTVATPRLEQRFDADFKEDRILQAQHGGSPKFYQQAQILQGSCHFHFTKLKHSALLKKCTPLAFAAPPPGLKLNTTLHRC